MDNLILDLSNKIIALLTPFLIKGTKEFISLAGEVAYKKAKELLAKLKSKLANDKEAIEKLEQFEKNPQRYKLNIEDILKEKLSKDKDSLEELIQFFKDVGPAIDVVQKLNEAENLVGLDANEIVSGKVQIEQRINKGKNITGAKFKRIG